MTRNGPTPEYVLTSTTYNADGTNLWGNAYQVVEDAGVGHINRTTTTTSYDGAGRAVTVTDPNGRQFQTTYNADGQVLAVANYVSGAWATNRFGLGSAW